MYVELGSKITFINAYAFSIIKIYLFYFFSDARNPFVEQALQYVIAAALAKFDQDKKHDLQKRLLLGDKLFSIFVYALSELRTTFWSSESDVLIGLVMQGLTLQLWAPMSFIHIEIRYLSMIYLFCLSHCLCFVSVCICHKQR